MERKVDYSGGGGPININTKKVSKVLSNTIKHGRIYTGTSNTPTLQKT